MNILFAINKQYIRHMKICIESIIRFKEKEGYDFYVIHSDLNENDIIEIEENFNEVDVRMHFIYVDPESFKDFPETDRYPKQIYYRIFASFLLPKHLEKALYLDVDIIVIRSLKELYKMDFEGKYYIACTHVRKILKKMNNIRLGIENDFPYINTGVMMMNLELLRQNQNINEVLDYVNKHKMNLMLPDQDIITALYGDKIKLIDTMIYNLSDRMLILYNSNILNEKIGIDWVRKNSTIIHYFGRNKPWGKNYIGILDVFYKEVLEIENKKRNNIKKEE